MLNLHYWPTANGNKITVFLEEAALDYRVFPIQLSKNEQSHPDFAAISPNKRIPAIVDLLPAIRGSPRTSGRASSWRTLRRCRAGSRASRRGRRRSAPMRWPMASSARPGTGRKRK